MSKKVNQKNKTATTLPAQEFAPQKAHNTIEVGEKETGVRDMDIGLDVNEFFDFSSEGSYGLEWVNKFLELDEDPWLAGKM